MGIVDIELHRHEYGLDFVGRLRPRIQHILGLSVLNLPLDDHFVNSHELRQRLRLVCIIKDYGDGGFCNSSVALFVD